MQKKWDYARKQRAIKAFTDWLEKNQDIYCIADGARNMFIRHSGVGSEELNAFIKNTASDNIFEAVNMELQKLGIFIDRNPTNPSSEDEKHPPIVEVRQTVVVEAIPKPRALIHTTQVSKPSKPPEPKQLHEPKPVAQPRRDTSDIDNIEGLRCTWSEISRLQGYIRTGDNIFKSLNGNMREALDELVNPLRAHLEIYVTAHAIKRRSHEAAYKKNIKDAFDSLTAFVAKSEKCPQAVKDAFQVFINENPYLTSFVQDTSAQMQNCR